MAEDQRKESDKKPKGEDRTAFVPNVSIEFTQDRGMRIQVDKAALAELFDQSVDMLRNPSQGCLSTPGGPRC